MPSRVVPRSAGTRLSATLVAGLLAVVVLLLGWRGVDWPAQLYRADLFRRVGFTQWDNQWYGGHHTPGYSLLFPPLGAIVGVSTVAAVSCMAASWAFASVADRYFSRRAARMAALWFASGTATNVAVGRVTFALGLALGLGAVAAMLRVTWWALLLAVLSPLASPVAGVFVAIAASGWWLASRGHARERRLALAVTVCALAPIAALSLSFPEGGRFPFLFGDLVLVIGACAIISVGSPRSWRALRMGAIVYAVIAAAVFFVPNPLGGNLTRLAMFVAGPVLAGLLWPRRKALLLAAGVPLVAWQWLPAVDAMVTAGRDPSTQHGYYQPLLDFLTEQPLTRIEIPFTKRHWETAFVAPHVALARGWERQLDFGVNSLFYEPGLTVDKYQQWLSTNAISYVALPDADLDDSAHVEAALLRAGMVGLQPAWHNEHWQVWRVADHKPLVEGPARLVLLEPDAFTLAIDSPGDILVRIRYSSHWDIDGPGCLVASPDGWTLLRAAGTGSLRVRQVVSRWVPFRPARTDECPIVAGK